MPKLNETQTILLSTASQRQSGSLLPMPDTITNVRGQITKAITVLIRADLIEERQTSDPGCVHREDGDVRYGLFITAEGLSAIGAESWGKWKLPWLSPLLLQPALPRPLWSSIC